MRRMFFVIGLALLLVGCRCVTPPTAPKTSFAENAFRNYLDSGEIPGAICIFLNNGEGEISCLGYADARTKRPITLDDPFMQCSQTKGFCGVCIAMLVEEGKISLDDPVSKYLPEFNELWVQLPEQDGVRRAVRAKNPLTIRMCLNHSSGLPFELPNFVQMGGWSRRMPLRSVAAVAASLPLLSEPGDRNEYSNLGIDIGAAIVEVVTGKRWEDFLQERVLDPLGMTSTTFWPNGHQLARRIQMASIQVGQKAQWKEYDPYMQPPFGDSRVFPSAGAGLWTTANDQLKFYKMLMNLGVGENGVRILKEETVKNILAVSTRPKGYGAYSLGFFAPETDGEDQWFGHGGAWKTDCSINWHKKQLWMFVAQFVGPSADDMRKLCIQTANEFFNSRREQ